FGIPRRPGDPEETTGRFDAGRIFIMINRGESWQCGFVIPKDSIARIHARGLPAFREEIVNLAPFVGDRVRLLDDWASVKLLTVRVDRLRQWYRAGLLCIGDAAHAMSPIGGVGINLAIQDAVATPNILGRCFDRTPSERDLRAVQRRRAFPTNATQRLQVAIQNNVIRRVLDNPKPLALPWPLK